MNGVRFYADYGTAKAKRAATQPHGQPTGRADNPLVLLVENGRDVRGCYGAVVALLDAPDSPLGSGCVADEYLRRNCRRISERLARQWYPQVAKWIDDCGVPA